MSLSRPQGNYDWVVIFLISFQLINYGLITELSYQFVYQSGQQERPLVAVILLFMTSFILQLCSLRRLLRYQNSAYLALNIFLIACLMRGVLFCSNPIQEVDYYRYIWDGLVVAHGENPYQTSPQQQLERVNSKADHTPSFVDHLTPDQLIILKRIHFAEYVTIYPPVSQACFALVALVIPADSSWGTYLLAMRMLLLLFDLFTLVLVYWLLKLTGKHVAWMIVYGWSPLVLKEITNSIHLDSIAIFFSILAICYWVKYFRSTRKLLFLNFSAISLSLAIGAKIYPLILLPVLALRFISQKQWFHAAVYSFCTLVLSLAILSPMYITQPASTTQHTSERGLTAFIKHWEMNDLCFMLVYENLKANPVQNHWFHVVPEFVKTAIVEAWSAYLPALPMDNFQLTRLFLLGVYLLIMLFYIRQILISEHTPSSGNIDDSHASDLRWLNLLWLSIAWFWILSPTQNPWYWLWAMPLVAFSKSSAWHLVAGALFLYYLRFYCAYHLDTSEYAMFGYTGEDIFHYLIVPVEHALWIVPLLVESIIRRNRQISNSDPPREQGIS